MAGGTAWLTFTAWRYGGEDPFRLQNLLDSDYRRLWDPSLPAVRPVHPERVRWFLLACGKVAAIVDGRMKDDRARAAPRRKR